MSSLERSSRESSRAQKREAGRVVFESKQASQTNENTTVEPEASEVESPETVVAENDAKLKKKKKMMLLAVIFLLVIVGAMALTPQKKRSASVLPKLDKTAPAPSLPPKLTPPKVATDPPKPLSGVLAEAVKPDAPRKAAETQKKAETPKVERLSAAPMFSDAQQTRILNAVESLEALQDKLDLLRDDVRVLKRAQSSSTTQRDLQTLRATVDFLDRELKSNQTQLKNITAAMWKKEVDDKKASMISILNESSFSLNQTVYYVGDVVSIRGESYLVTAISAQKGVTLQDKTGAEYLLREKK